MALEKKRPNWHPHLNVSWDCYRLHPEEAEDAAPAPGSASSAPAGSLPPSSVSPAALAVPAAHHHHHHHHPGQTGSRSRCRPTWPGGRGWPASRRPAGASAGGAWASCFSSWNGCHMSHTNVWVVLLSLSLSLLCVCLKRRRRMSHTTMKYLTYPYPGNLSDFAELLYYSWSFAIAHYYGGKLYIIVLD